MDKRIDGKADWRTDWWTLPHTELRRRPPPPTPQKKCSFDSWLQRQARPAVDGVISVKSMWKVWKKVFLPHLGSIFTLSLSLSFSQIAKARKKGKKKLKWFVIFSGKRREKFPLAFVNWQLRWVRWVKGEKEKWKKKGMGKVKGEKADFSEGVSWPGPWLIDWLVQVSVITPRRHYYRYTS